MTDTVCVQRILMENTMKQRQAPALTFLLIVLSASLSSQQTLAEVYKRVDENGKVIFSDQPADDAEAVEIKDVNTAQPVKARSSLVEDDNEEAAEYSVSITSPKDEQLFPNRLSPFTVSTKVSPALQEGHRLRLKIDGKTHSISVGSFTVSKLDLGEHTLVVEIIDASDTVITRSSAISIFARNPG